MKTCFIVFALLFVTPTTPLPGAERPNVILVMTDDQGYGELSSHGNPILRTPHLDRLRSESVRFTDFHVAPMCTPTRGQLLTGCDAARNGATTVNSGRALLRTQFPTLADFFRANGYRTGMFGKWHLGDNYPFRPQDRGFDETLWFPGSHINSIPDFWDNDYFDDTYSRNGQRQAYSGYCTDVFFAEAIEWMKACADAQEPFFVYLPTNAPHTPHWSPKEYQQQLEADFAEAEASGRFTRKIKPNLRKRLIHFLAMIRNIDDNFGRLETFLSDSGLWDNTVVIFLSDNGSLMGASYFNAGMRGRKRELWEGGHRVPCFVRWPSGRLGQPRDIDGLAQVQDLFPTLIDLCGLNPPDLKQSTAPHLDGISLAPVLRGRGKLPDDRMLVINYGRVPIHFNYPSPDAPSRMRREGAAVLWRRWRLLEGRELYDLATDPTQRSNVIEQHPEVAAKMANYLDIWWEEVREIANEHSRVVIGADAENPMMLTTCEWLDVPIDGQKLIRQADRKNGYWELEVAQPGSYELELRRWPKESGLALRADLPATKVTDGVLIPGVAIPIGRARIVVDRVQHTQQVQPDDRAAKFTIPLEAGNLRLHTWFDDDDRQPICGAYYVYVRRL